MNKSTLFMLLEAVNQLLQEIYKFFKDGNN